MSWKFPELDIAPPKGAITDGLFKTPYGMQSWQNKKNKFVVVACHFSADPKRRSKQWWDKATENLRPDQIERELLIKFNSRGGQRVFPFLEMDPEKFVKPKGFYRKGSEWNIPSHWPIIVGLDYGGKNPTSMHFYAIDEKKNWHSFWEFYKPSHYVEIAQILKSHPLYGRVMKVVADPSIWNKTQQEFKENVAVIKSIHELLEDQGIYKLERGINDRLAGLERVKQVFNQFDPENKSKFFISEECPEQWNEFINLIYKPETPQQLVNKNPSDDILKKDDHSYDEARYVFMSWDYEADYAGEAQRSEFSLDLIEEEIDHEYEKDFNELFALG